MIEPLNSPVEVGVRVLALLDAAYPRSLDVDRLSLLDHVSLHSADFGGPESLLPELSRRSSELTANRRRIEGGLSLMVRAGLVETDISDGGIQYRASDSSAHFFRSLQVSYLERLRDSDAWAIDGFGDLTDAEVGSVLRSIVTTAPPGDQS